MSNLRHLRQLKIRTRCLAYAFIIACSVFISIGTPWVNSVSAKTHKEMSTTEQAQSYTYLYALSACISENGSILWSPDSITNLNYAKNINNGDWFTNATALAPPSKAASFLTPGADNQGLTSCNVIVKSASTLWGYKNPGELYCSFMQNQGCQFGNVSQSTIQTGTPVLDSALATRANAMRQVVTQKVYGGNLSGIPDASHMYLYYYRAFVNGCGAVEDSNASGDTAYTVTIANTDGSTSQKKYKGAKQSDKKYVYRGSSGAVQKTCKQISEELSSYAPAFAKAKPEEVPTPPAATEESKEPETSCILNGIGWIVCPALNISASMADAAYAFLAKDFLEIDSNLLNTDSSKTNSDTGRPVGTGALNAWRAMQTIANIAFVIAFLVIIYSQLTSSGVGNYGVKRLLPRIIIAAILVNTSFIICQAAVDLSNVLGYGLKSMFEVIDISGVDKADIKAVSGASFGFADLAEGILSGTIAVVAVGAGIYLALPFLAGAVLATLVALASVGFILIARKALIILFVVISPIAFVAYLLPNTEHLFKRWYSIFSTLLLLFPVVGVLFGAGALASKILVGVSNGDPILRIVALAAAAIPLFAVIPVLKGALNGVGNIGAKINGISSKAEGNARARGKRAWDASRFGQAREFRKQQRAQTRALAQSGVYTGNSRLGKAYAGIHDRLNNSRLSGAAGSALAAQGIVAANEQDEKAIKDSMALLQNKGLTADQVQKVAMGEEVMGIDSGNENLRRAAIRKSMSEGGLAASEQLIANSGNMNPALYKEISKGVLDNKLGSQANYLGGDMADKIARGEIKSQADLDVAAAKRISGGKFSAESLASQDAKALERISKVMNGVEDGQYSAVDKTGAVVQTVPVDPQQHQALQDQAFEIRKEDGKLRNTITGEQARHIENIDLGRR